MRQVVLKVVGIILASLLLVAVSLCALADPLPKMRPYSGIGLLRLQELKSEQGPPLLLYKEPGLARLNHLDPDRLPGHDWIFGVPASAAPLIVTGRKGPWLRVVYDDAGREGWLNPPRSDSFQTWDQYLGNRVVSLLPGLPPRYLQLFRRPNRNLLAVLTPQHAFTVLQVDHDWVQVLVPERGEPGWLRWRDEDGRLLIGIGSGSALSRQ